MSFQINNNITALGAYNSVSKVSNLMSKSMGKLSKGLRIADASDDPAGLISSELFRSQIVSMDSRLKDLVAQVPAKDPPGAGVRQEHLALLARWFYSTWRDGEWIGCQSLGTIPIRKIVNAIGRLAKPRP